MTDRPEFPQADPALQYVAREIAKLDEVAYCSTGYYKMQKDHKARQDKLVETINLLRHDIQARKDISDEITSRIREADLEAAKRLNEFEEASKEVLRSFEGGLDRITTNVESRTNDHLLHMTREIDKSLKEIRDAANHPGEVYVSALEAASESITDRIQSLFIVTMIVGIVVGATLCYLIVG